MFVFALALLAVSASASPQWLVQQPYAYSALPVAYSPLQHTLVKAPIVVPSQDTSRGIPQPVEDTPEVKLAKKEFEQHYINSAIHSSLFRKRRSLPEEDHHQAKEKREVLLTYAYPQFSASMPWIAEYKPEINQVLAMPAMLKKTATEDKKGIMMMMDEEKKHLEMPTMDDKLTVMVKPETVMGDAMAWKWAGTHWTMDSRPMMYNYNYFKTIPEIMEAGKLVKTPASTELLKTVPLTTYWPSPLVYY